MNGLQILSKVGNPVHKKLWESYMDTQYLMEVIQVEVLEGAPGPWDLLGEGG